ncbi:hypothetical protein [Belnapia rosea]|uniref:hypothetical protein n=1 Tax=Belnapia rosea TaxID=938405 RepID=UPI000883349C|nr:hypothetical protein [Belnapia rosea]SDB74623.1 hypothetical protein SAMN02927895_05325 [Belnapia rosea]
MTMPTPEQVADAMNVALMVGELRRLAEASRRQADHYEGASRQRMLDCAESTLQTVRLIEALDQLATEEEARGEG